MRPLCMCHHYVDKPMYRPPYDVYFGNEKDLEGVFNVGETSHCSVEGIDSFLYFGQNKTISEEIIIKKSYSRFFKKGVYSFCDNFMSDDKNVIFLTYNSRENEVIYKVKIYDIEKFNVNYSTTGTLLDLELKISYFKQSYEFVSK